MFIRSFSAGPWETNCYLVAPSAKSECVIIDPGYECAEQVGAIVSEFGLKPVAVLVTHGHLDHMWSVFPVAKGYDIPAFIHGRDRSLLANPLAGVSNETVLAMRHLAPAGLSFVEPDSVIEIGDRAALSLGGMSLSVMHAPGHTPGSVLFDFLDSEVELNNIFTGDVLFQRAIGRTDLPGGSASAMEKSLTEVVLPLADDSLIFPGHGPSTTMEIERATNPYLRRVAQGLSLS